MKVHQLGSVVALCSIVPTVLGSIFANQPLRRDTTDICAQVDVDLDILGINLGKLGNKGTNNCFVKFR